MSTDAHLAREHGHLAKHHEGLDKRVPYVHAPEAEAACCKVTITQHGAVFGVIRWVEDGSLGEAVEDALRRAGRYNADPDGFTIMVSRERHGA
jgi:hypothetical protein